MDWLNLIATIALFVGGIWIGKTLYRYRTKYNLALLTIILTLFTISLIDLISPGKFNSVLAAATYVFSDNPTVVKVVRIVFHWTLVLVLFAVWFYPNVKEFLTNPKSIRDPDKRDKLYRFILKIFPHNSEILSRYAYFLCIVKKEYDKAEVNCLKALAIEPKSSNVLGIYAILLEEMGQYDKAKNYYEEAIEQDPDNGVNLSNYARFLMYKQKEYSTAEDYFKKAIELDSKNPELLAMYAYVMEMTEKHDQAELFYEKAINADSKNRLALLRYARFLTYIKEDYDRAEEYFEKAVKADPKSVSTIHNYAFFLWTIHKDYDRAEVLFQKALQLEPDNQELLDSYSDFLTEKSL